MKKPSQRRLAGMIIGLSGLMLLGALGALTSARITTRRSGGPRAVAPDMDLIRLRRPLPLPRAVERAAHIWRGTVLNVDQAARETLLRLGSGETLFTRRDQAQFHVERVLKGRQVSGVRPITFYVTPGSRLLSGLEPGQHGLVFLDRTEQVVDPARPILPLGPSAIEGPPPDNALEAVKQEMLAGGAVQELVYALNVDFAQVEPTLRRVAMSPDDAAAAIGLRAFTHYHIRPALATAVEIALARAAEVGPRCRHALDDIAHVRNPALAPAIDPLLDTDVFEWRLAALRALVPMRSRDHIHRFAAALYEDDPEIQFEAVSGLGAALDVPRDEWASPQRYITHAEFDRDGPAYVARWKRWWKSEGRAQYGKQ